MSRGNDLSINSRHRPIAVLGFDNSQRARFFRINQMDGNTEKASAGYAKLNMSVQSSPPSTQ